MNIESVRYWLILYSATSRADSNICATYDPMNEVATLLPPLVVLSWSEKLNAYVFSPERRFVDDTMNRIKSSVFSVECVDI